jgi:nicotinate phosphoribosyltransferase
MPFVRSGGVLAAPTLDDIRVHHRAAMAELPASAHQLDPGDPAVPTRYEGS